MERAVTGVNPCGSDGEIPTTPNNISTIQASAVARALGNVTMGRWILRRRPAPFGSREETTRGVKLRWKETATVREKASVAERSVWRIIGASGIRGRSTSWG